MTSFSCDDLCRRTQDQKLLGSGAYGDVYQVMYDGQLACLKKGRHDLCFKEFQREADLLRLVGGAGGCPKLLALSKDQPCYVMTYTSGDTLRDVAHHQNLRVAQWLDVFLSVVKAVKELHDVGVIHCDIHSKNVMLDLPDNGTVRAKLIDLGLAELYDKKKFTSLSTYFTRTFNKLRKIMKLTPLKNSGRIGPHTDIYQLGVMLENLILLLNECGGPKKDEWPESLKKLCRRMVHHQAISRPTMQETVKELGRIKKTLSK